MPRPVAPVAKIEPVRREQLGRTRTDYYARFVPGGQHPVYARRPSLSRQIQNSHWEQGENTKSPVELSTGRGSTWPVSRSLTRMR